MEDVTFNDMEEVMRIQFPNGNSVHVSREVGEAFVLGGYATDVTPRQPVQPLPKCELVWRVMTSVHQSEPIITWRCAACRIEGTGRAFHKGQHIDPPAHLGTAQIDATR